MVEFKKVRFDEIEHYLKKVNEGIWRAMRDMANNMDNTSQYLLFGEYEHGENLIQGGEVVSQGELFDQEFVREQRCSTDFPFSVVLEGRVEVHFDQRVRFGQDWVEFPAPLGVFLPGDVFGVFGTADRLSNVETTYKYSYSATTGYMCSYPLLPRELTSGKKEYKAAVYKLAKKYQSRGVTDSLELFREYQQDFFNKRGDRVKLLILPWKWLDAGVSEDPGSAMSPLNQFVFQTAWRQMSNSRNSEHANYLNPRDKHGGKEQEFRQLRLPAIEYLRGVRANIRPGMIPLRDRSHELWAVSNALYKDLEESYYPVIFYYDYLNNIDGIAILPTYYVPFLRSVNLKATEELVSPLWEHREEYLDFVDEKDFISDKVGSVRPDEFWSKFFRDIPNVKSNIRMVRSTIIVRPHSELK